MTENKQFIRINSDFIALKKDCGINSLGSLGLYSLISAFLSNPNFETSFGGFKEAVLKHCSNGRYSFCGAWNCLKENGFLKRTRIPSGVHEFHDYYTLLNFADKSLPEVTNLKFTEAKKFLIQKRAFSAPVKNYTEVSYKMLMDANLSLTAKGLYAVIKKFTDFYNNGADIVICKDSIRKAVKMGFRSFNTAWKELKQSGYLSVKRLWDFEKNQIRYIYTLDDVSVKTSINKQKAVKEKPIIEKVLPKPKKDKKFPIIKAPTLEPDKKTILTIKNNIEYDVLLEKDLVKEYAEMVFDVLIDTLSLNDNTVIKFSDGKLSAKDVKQRIMELTHEDVESVCLKYHQVLLSDKTINNPAYYIRTLLLNAKRDLKYQMQKIEAEVEKAYGI